MQKFSYSLCFRNLIFPALLYLFLEKLFGFIFYIALFKNWWLPYASIYRPMDDFHWTITMPVAAFLYGVVISGLYYKCCKISQKQIPLLPFALVFFMVGRFFGEIYSYAMYPYSLETMLVGMLHGLFTMVFWALISKKIFVLNIK